MGEYDSESEKKNKETIEKIFQHYYALQATQIRILQLRTKISNIEKENNELKNVLMVKEL